MELLNILHILNCAPKLVQVNERWFFELLNLLLFIFVYTTKCNPHF